MRQEIGLGRCTLSSSLILHLNTWPLVSTHRVIHLLLAYLEPRISSDGRQS